MRRIPALSPYFKMKPWLKNVSVIFHIKRNFTRLLSFCHMLSRAGPTVVCDGFSKQRDRGGTKVSLTTVFILSLITVSRMINENLQYHHTLAPPSQSFVPLRTLAP